MGRRKATPFASLDRALTYDEQRIAWRRALPELVCRELASDYLRGNKDEINFDAYQEFLQRYGPRQRAPFSRRRQSGAKRK